MFQYGRAGIESLRAGSQRTPSPRPGQPHSGIQVPATTCPIQIFSGPRIDSRSSLASRTQQQTPRPSAAALAVVSSTTAFEGSGNTPSGRGRERSVDKRDRHSFDWSGGRGGTITSPFGLKHPGPDRRVGVDPLNCFKKTHGKTGFVRGPVSKHGDTPNFARRRAVGNRAARSLEDKDEALSKLRTATDEVCMESMSNASAETRDLCIGFISCNTFLSIQERTTGYWTSRSPVLFLKLSCRTNPSEFSVSSYISYAVPPKTNGLALRLSYVPHIFVFFVENF